MQIVSNFTAHSISTLSIGFPLYKAAKEILYFNNATSNSGQAEEAKEHEELLKKEKIRSDFSIRFAVCAGSNHVLGVNYPVIGDVVIHIWPGVKETDKDAYNFLLLRQIFYLQNNESTNSFLQASGIAVASFVAAYMTTYSPWLACFSAMAASQISQTVRYFKASAEADDFAIQHASNKYLEGGLRFLVALKKIRLECAKMKVPPILAEKFADGFYFGYQTLLSQRIVKIKMKMKEKNIKVSRNFETEKSISLLANTMQKSLKGLEHRYFDLL